MIDPFSKLLYAICVLIEVIALPLVSSQEDDLLFAINLLRIPITLFSIWNLTVYIQMLPVVGHVVVYIREMISDLFAFIIIFAFCNAVFSRQLILFFNLNSNDGCNKVHYYNNNNNNICSTGSLVKHALVATIQFLSRVDIFLHMSFVFSVLNFSSVLYYALTCILKLFFNSFKKKIKLKKKN